ncbi:hypothetical protein ACHAXT_011839 [Thalassiosira profunda]
MHDLYRTKNQIQEIISGYIEGLGSLEEHRNEYSDDEFQDFLFSAIQQSSRELQELVIDPFVQRNGESQLEFEDYASYIELRKLIDSAHADVRNGAKRLLPIDPDDTSHWRNALRRCQHCGEIWVKVEGCDGATTCGLVPQAGDDWGEESYVKCWWDKVNGTLRPRKVGKRKKGRVSRESSADANEIRVGCGREIDWKNQAIVPMSEVNALFSTQELEQLLASFSSKPDFVAKKREREASIPVFTELDGDGKDI